MIHKLKLNHGKLKIRPDAFYTEKDYTELPAQTIDLISTLEYVSHNFLLEDELLAYANQTHSSHIEVVEKPIPKFPYAETDGLITNLPSVCLCIQTADCTPIILFDPVTLVVGVLHAGWRGTAKNICGNAIDIMKNKFGVNPENVSAYIGPSISQSVYEVGEDVFVAFKELSLDMEKVFIPGNKVEKYYCNVKEANRQILLAAGLDNENILVSEHCTFSEPDKFYSARRDGIDTGRMITGIILREKD